MTQESASPLTLSVVVPVHNELENIGPQLDELFAVLEGRGPFEVIYVDDGSTDGSLQRLREERARRGRSKYGVHNRLWVGIVDMMGVAWLQRRERRPAQLIEVSEDEL